MDKKKKQANNLVYKYSDSKYTQITFKFIFTTNKVLLVAAYIFIVNCVHLKVTAKQILQ